MTLWPKWKTIRTDVGKWTQIRWRPLVSYRQGFWRHLFRLTARVINALAASPSGGFSVRSLLDFRIKVNSFNQDFRRGSFDSEPAVRAEDIDDFFTCCPRGETQDMIRDLVARHMRKDVGMFI